MPKDIHYHYHIHYNNNESYSSSYINKFTNNQPSLTYSSNNSQKYLTNDDSQAKCGDCIIS